MASQAGSPFWVPRPAAYAANVIVPESDDLEPIPAKLRSLTRAFTEQTARPLAPSSTISKAVPVPATIPTIEHLKTTGQTRVFNLFKKGSKTPITLYQFAPGTTYYKQPLNHGLYGLAKSGLLSPISSFYPKPLAKRYAQAAYEASRSGPGYSYSFDFSKQRISPATQQLFKAAEKEARKQARINSQKQQGGNRFHFTIG